jgi:hypothetical protein
MDTNNTVIIDDETLPSDLPADVLAKLSELASISDELERIDRDLEESHKRRMLQMDVIAAQVQADARLIDQELDELERDEAMSSDILDEIAMNEAMILARMEEEDESNTLVGEPHGVPSPSEPGV